MVASAAGAATETSAATTRFKLFVSRDGVYRVGFEALQAAGLAAESIPSGQLALSSRGEAVPLWVDDGGDGRLGPGDGVEFVGRHVPGERSWFDEYTRSNVYWLATDGEAGTRVRSDTGGAAPRAVATRLQALHHEEAERLLVRFAAPRQAGPSETGSPATAAPEPWYWAKLTPLDAEPFRISLPLAGRDLQGTEPLSLRIRLRGWSAPARSAPGAPADHRVELLLDGAPVAVAEWLGQEATTLQLSLPPGELAGAEPELAVRVAPRSDSVDVVLLDWIEASFPVAELPAVGQGRFLAPRGSAKVAVEVVSPAPGLVVYDAAGNRLALAPTAPAADGRFAYRFSPPAAGELFVVAGEETWPVDAVELDQPSSLRTPSRQADYLIVAHPRLLDAVAPLADFHRRRGLEVAVADVRDVYDEFRDGLTHPAALRDFFAYARSSWQAPAPRFVLLVGDASWDPTPAADDSRYADWTYRPGEVQAFIKNGSDPYREAAPQGRELVPAFRAQTFEGHAASDNWLVDVEGDDGKPELAIGRFPVTEPSEVAAIVEKTIAYAAAGDGEWRRRVLWITNEMQGMQTTSNQLAEGLEGRGYESVRLYPSAQESDNVAHQRWLRETFGSGLLLVHFLGHGGRYIWRTGAPDYQKNHDLFTLDDLDALTPTAQLPLVLSMTCYSAPFDHPTADSIGEKLLRVPGRGAVGVLAASWRNSPGRAFSEALLEELTQPGTVGEAILRAKQRPTSNRLLVETYNFLGDPALELALPAETDLTTAAVDAEPAEAPAGTSTGASK